ncbi:hypothetical protein BJV78DRAFT_355846 [Lactifluus subvellereus]|nr:hypothetical protein BJV78DRAFT_355846 [Lactifluus subvellereus]
MYTALFVFSAFFMLRRGLSNRTRKTMLVVSVIMYAAAASHWALNMSIAARRLRAIPPSEAVVLLYVTSVNYILSDGIVLWRAWVLWNRRSVLFIPPLIFLLSTLVLSVAAAATSYKDSVTKSVRKTDTSHTLKWCIWGFTISTNLWATCLIFIRAWQHRRFLRRQLGKENATSKAERGLIFLVESGALYLCLWVTFIITALVAPPVVVLFRTSIVELVGIYPTAIFVVVTMQMSAADILSHPDLQVEPRHHSSTVIFTPSSPTVQSSILAMTVGGSSDSSSLVGPREDMSTKTLAPSDPEKERKIVEQDVI